MGRILESPEWDRDLSGNHAKMTQKGGACAPDHPRRCQGMNDYTQAQCHRFGLKLTEPPYCKRCSRGGRSKAFLATQKGMGRNIYEINKGSRMSALLGKVSEDPEKKFSLADEIDVSRAQAMQAMVLYNACLEDSAKPFKEQLIDDGQKVMAEMLLTQGLKNVSALIEKHAKVTALSKNTFTVEQQEHMMRNIMAILVKHLQVNSENDTIFQSIMQDIDNIKPVDETKVVLKIS